MRAFIKERGRGIVIDRENIDTDQIIAARHLKSIRRTGFGPHAFEAWRQEPDFPLNNPSATGAKFLITGGNFGCGSSREHAPWALQDLGLRCIIAPSFADIFAGNCASIALLTVRLPRSECRAISQTVIENPQTELTIDLPSQSVHWGNRKESYCFELDQTVKDRLMTGQDPVTATLMRIREIEAHERTRPAHMPRTDRETGGCQ